jgi:ComF family protein
VLSRLLAPPLCWGCGGLVRGEQAVCLRCRRTLRHLPRHPIQLAGVPAWAPVSYEGVACELVRALKFRGAVALADTMAALMAANAPKELLPPAGRDDRPAAPAVTGGRPAWRAPVLVPVPLHPARRRRRGFNQAAILAEALARRTSLSVANSLSRSGAAGSQVGRPRPARLSGPPGRIRAHGPVPARAVLVDDVATTGATLAACARALRAADALEVRAIAFARTLGR